MIKRGIYPLIQVKQTHLIGSRQNGNYPDPISLRFREEMTREGLTVRNLGGTLDKWVSHAGLWHSSSCRPRKKCNGILIQPL